MGVDTGTHPQPGRTTRLTDSPKRHSSTSSSSDAATNDRAITPPRIQHSIELMGSQLSQ
jgi:hypothetical protein